MTHIAFLGLGAMGARMAQRLLPEHTLTVWNRTPERAAPLLERGAQPAATPREAAAQADLLITMLTDDEAAAQVWLDPQHGALAGLRPGALALECSTVTPAWMHRLGEAANAQQVRLLDAPVVGSTPQADAGHLTFLIGGDEDALTEARPILALLGANTLHAGALGQGALLKLAVNALFAGQVALLAELLHAVEAHGLDPRHAAHLLALLPVTSPAANGAAQLMLAADHAPRFPLDLALKDLRYAAALGDLPLIHATRDRFAAAAAAGLGALNLTALHNLHP